MPTTAEIPEGARTCVETFVRRADRAVIVRVAAAVISVGMIMVMFFTQKVRA
jgi:hypothetical protein